MLRFLRETWAFLGHLRRARRRNVWTRDGLRAARRITRRDPFAMIPVHALNHGEKEAVLASDATLTYAQLLERVRNAAPPSRFVVATNTAETIVAFAMLGDAAVAVSPTATDAERKKLEEAAKVPGTVLITAGSTGAPKPVALDTGSMGRLRALQIMAACGFDNTVRFYTACPLSHAAPRVFAGFTLAMGGTLVLAEKFVAERAWAEWDALSVTTVFVVPTQLVRLLALPDALLEKKPRALVRILCGGAPFSPTLKQRALDRLGPIVYDFYGASELGLVSLATPDDLRTHPQSVGRPLPGVRVRIVDGEVFVTSPLCKNRSAGDLGRLEDGRLYLTGRKTDLIITGGVNVYPREIEDVLLAHPAVLEVCVRGLPDEEWGEAVTAFVALNPGYVVDAAALIAHCGASLAPAKKPKRVVILPELPKTAAGKIDRVALG